MDEPAWLEADSAVDFRQYFPFDTSMAVSPTVARILYDDQFIYVLGIMQNLELLDSLIKMNQLQLKTLYKYNQLVKF